MARFRARPKGVPTLERSERITLSLSSFPCVRAICSYAARGTSCLRSAEGYAPAEGTRVAAAGSGLALAASVRSWDSDQVPSRRASRASAIVCAWLAEGMRCGATTMLRFLPVCRPSVRLWARNRCVASVDADAFVRSPRKAVDRGASATTAVVPPPMGRAADGVYDRPSVSLRLSLRAMTLSAPAEVATLMMEG